MRLLNEFIDASEKFTDVMSSFFIAEKLVEWDSSALSGKIEWKRSAMKVRQAFNQSGEVLEAAQAWKFPPDYDENPALNIKIHLVSLCTVRVKIYLADSLFIAENRDSAGMLISPGIVDELCSESRGFFTVEESSEKISIFSDDIKLEILRDPFEMRFYDGEGHLLTSTVHPHTLMSLRNSDSPVFSIVESVEDTSQTGCFAFSLQHDEAFYGTGESFTRLNKRGQKTVLWTEDANSCQRNRYYKPIPFFISSRGYGMFLHTSTPAAFDFGCKYDGTGALYAEDSVMDLFFFSGSVKEVLSEYTSLTGRSPVPPLWSFGLWMSRITYKSETEVQSVAERLRSEKIPCDVIHIDTGWFEKDWICDYEFSGTRFDNPEKLIARLNRMGLRVSLWQLPYFTPNNPLYREALEKGYAVRSGKAGLPTEDVIIDFSNPDAVFWYKSLLKKLLMMGVSAIKADFGEAAPYHGIFHSGKTGHSEHNLYPLRYNKAVYEITDEVCGEGIIWGRSAWAGSQRYPVHWGGDSENTDSAMAASLRAGLSLGLSGFSFWSHDIGGFVKSSPEDIYRRWLTFGMFSSHSRCHGAPPTEPWEYNKKFTDFFRSVVERKYRLMPYVMAQSVICSRKGFPMVRPLFFEFPEDRTCWNIEDEYLFGSSILVAPVFSGDSAERDVYLPPGKWLSIEHKTVYEGSRWARIPGEIGGVPVLVRWGTLIPEVPAVLSTDFIQWDRMTYEAYGDNPVEGISWTPEKGLYSLTGEKTEDGSYVIEEEGLAE